MANYAVANSTTGGAGTAQANLSATYATQLSVAASSASGAVNTGLRRGKIYDILVGTAGTPADNYVEWEGIRVTAATTVSWAGTISSVSSAYALDMADTGFSASVVMNASAETNLAITSGQVWYVGVNQRASYRWVAAPGSELVYPAVSSGTGGNGIAIKARGSATVPGTVNLMFQEQ